MAREERTRLTKFEVEVMQRFRHDRTALVEQVRSASDGGFIVVHGNAERMEARIPGVKFGDGEG